MSKANLLVGILLLSNFTPLFSGKSSDEIQKDINKKNERAKSLEHEIDKLASEIQNKNVESKTTSHRLATIKEKIELTGELIDLLKKAEKDLSTSITDTEIRINKKQDKLKQLKEKFSKMIIHLYKSKSDNYLDMLLSSENWGDMIYKVKYLEVISQQQKEIKKDVESIINQLDNEILILTNQLLNKKKERKNKNTTISKLGEATGKEEDKLKKIQEEKFSLEKNRTEKKTELVQVNSMIEKLYANRDSAKKREEKLKRIREEKRKKEVEASQKNRKFSTMKGKLPWPVEGSITSQVTIKVG